MIVEVPHLKRKVDKRPQLLVFDIQSSKASLIVIALLALDQPLKNLVGGCTNLKAKTMLFMTWKMIQVDV